METVDTRYLLQAFEDAHAFYTSVGMNPGRQMEHFEMYSYSKIVKEYFKETHKKKMHDAIELVCVVHSLGFLNEFLLAGEKDEILLAQKLKMLAEIYMSILPNALFLEEIVKLLRPYTIKHWTVAKGFGFFRYMMFHENTNDEHIERFNLSLHLLTGFGIWMQKHKKAEKLILRAWNSYSTVYEKLRSLVHFEEVLKLATHKGMSFEMFLSELIEAHNGKEDFHEEDAITTGMNSIYWFIAIMEGFFAKEFKESRVLDIIRLAYHSYDPYTLEPILDTVGEHLNIVHFVPRDGLVLCPYSWTSTSTESKKDSKKPNQ